MSAQSLLELEDLSQVAEREKPKPKPRPRSKIPQPEWSSPSKFKSEQDEDDVISISSGGGSIGGEKRKLHYSKPESSTVSAFDNPAFLTDEDDNQVKIVSTNLGDNAHRPEPSRRKRRPNESIRRLSSGSSQVESDNNTRLGRGRITPEEDANRNDKERVDYDSTSTYTVENEKYNQHRLDKKPPKPKPRPKQKSLFVSDDERGTRTGTPSDSELSDETRREKVEGESAKAPPKKRAGHLTVQIDPNATHENDENIDGNNDKSASNQPEAGDTVSISSSLNIPKETTVKQSRFSKLFASSSSDDKKKVAASTEGSKEKPSLVNRWRKTFMKASSKSIEESEATEEGQDEEKVEAKTSSPNEKKAEKGKTKETRIFMPESSSNEEEDDEHDISSKSGVTVASGIKAEETRNLDADIEKGKPEKAEEIPQEKHTRFGPMAKLLRSRSKDKEVDPNKRDKSVESKGKDEGRDKVDLSKSAQREKSSKSEIVVKGESKEKVGQMKKWKEALEKVQSEKVKKQRRTLPPSSSEEEISESNDSDKEKSKSPAPRPRRKHAAKSQEPLKVTDSGGKDLLFGVTIHSSDLLPLDPNVIHPVVKVSLMLQGGLYIKRGGGSSDVVSSKSERKSRDGNRRRSKGSSAEQLSTTNISESVLPIMSQPCQARHSIPTFAPTWNELVVFEEPFRRFTLEGNHGDSEYEPILFFEIMDFLPMTSNGTMGGATSTSGYHGSEPGWYKLAWAFLKPIGTNGHVNLGKKLRLQLFKPVKLRRKDKLPGPEPYSWWKSGKREKINATLYVTPKGIIPPETTTASLRQLLSMRKEHLTQAILDSQLATKRKTSKGSKKASAFELRELANWSKMEGQSCRPPNKLVASLPSSQIESLNIVISGNVHSLKFSPCGTKLAAGLDTDELHVILLFQVRSWTLQKTLKGHHGIIYDIAWKIFEFDEQTSFHYLASASADATVRIWKMENSDEKTLALFKVLHHPSYVYCVRFHPTHPNLIATGCFDNIIRLWDMMPKNEDHQGQAGRRYKSSRKEKCFDETSPVILLDKHNSFVNCLLFDPDGTTLFSGDGSACLFKWTCKSPGLKKSWKLEKDVKLHPSAIPVNSIDLHPSGNRILVHLRDSSIRILDVVSFISLQTFPGIKNERLQISSCFSPCGNLVLSGSEDSTLCIWDADTAKILQFLNPPNHPSCVVTCVDYHPFDYFVAVGLSSTISEPSPVLVYFYEPAKLASYPLLKRTAKKMRESLEKSRSQSTESFEDVNGNISGRSRSFSSTKRGSSSEKFLSIIQKLDTALYFAQQRNKMRQTETQKSICASSSQEQVEDNLDEEEAQLRKTETESMNLVEEEGRTDNNMKTHFIKKSRPRSASTATKEKRHKYRQGNQRANLSDSEQMYKLKLESVSVEYEQHAPESTVFQQSRMESDEPEKETYEGKITVVAEDGDVDFKVGRPRPLSRRTTTNGLLDKPNDTTKTRNNSLD